MKYLAMLFSLIFAMNAPALSDEATRAPEDLTPVTELVDTAGVVTEITDETLTIDTEDRGQVLVHLTEETLWEGETPVVGAYIHIVNNGAMTMSIPPQITALRVGCYAFTGTVSELAEGAFMLTTAEGAAYQVNAEAEKLTALTDGQDVTVYSNGAMTMSIPPQIYGELIVPAE